LPHSWGRIRGEVLFKNSLGGVEWGVLLGLLLENAVCIDGGMSELHEGEGLMNLSLLILELIFA
jgi:hypothetical protein